MHVQDEGVPMSPETRKRWYLAQGIDFVDDDHDDWTNASLSRSVTKSTALLLRSCCDRVELASSASVAFCWVSGQMPRIDALQVGLLYRAVSGVILFHP